MKSDIPINPEQRWEWVKYQLRQRGSSLYKLGRELDVTGGAVQNAKYMPYPRMERAIARKVGLTPADIWPERWNADGTPSRQRPNRAEKRKTVKPQKQLAVNDSGSNAIAHRQAAARA